MEKYIFGTADAPNILIQMVDDNDLDVIESEVSHIKTISDKDFCLTAIKVDNWFKDLSPWKAPAVFGNEDFGDGASETLRRITDEIIQPGNKDPYIIQPANKDPEIIQPDKKSYYIGGYSLSGLFALWAACQTDIFAGVAAASPSVWFPGFTRYVRENRVRAQKVYLSLGDKEAKTRNQVMAMVDNAIREVHACLNEQGIDCILEWNSGNHFREPDLRTAKAFSWLIK